MRMWRSIAVVGSLLVCLALITLEGRPEGAGQRGNAGGRGDAATVGPGHLLTGAWGSDPLARRPARLGLDDEVVREAPSTSVRSRTRRRSCCSAASRSPATRLAASIRTFYCEVRKHYGYVWFEMQHSTMSWDEVAKMIAACPGPTAPRR